MKKTDNEVNQPSEVRVSFSSDPDYVIKGLTSDVTTIECIYDLIDNSIDAARNSLLKIDTKKDKFGLPSSYNGYEIRVSIDNKNVTILDNCSGIDEKTLSNKTFTIGSRSQHPYGIGHYGVGLNRAIFKLGAQVHLITDDGIDQFSLTFSESEVRKAVANTIEIKANRLKTTNKKFNLIKISSINSEVYSDLGSAIWLKSTTDEIRKRYGIFTSKNLKILINDVPIGTFGPEIRDPVFLRKRERTLFSQSRVNIYMESGLHQDYRIKSVDDDYQELKSGIPELTKEYGWYVVCNDRIILVADKTKITGWTTSWHNEYHGFLGWAYYVSEDPSLLPWDSKKTGINSNNKAHEESLPILKGLADSYRTDNRKLRKPKIAAPASNSISVARPKDPKALSGPQGTTQKSNDWKPAVIEGTGVTTNNEKNDLHTNDMDYLVYAIRTISTSPRTTSLLQEAKETSIKQHPYSAIVLLRVLFECALREFAIRHKFYNTIKESYFSEQDFAGRPFTDKQKKDYSPNLQKMITWLLQNTENLPNDHRRAASLSLGKFKKDLSTINGIIHEDGVLTDNSEVNQIRNNAYKALQTLLEN
jgi:hypothetical protein